MQLSSHLTTSLNYVRTDDSSVSRAADCRCNHFKSRQVRCKSGSSETEGFVFSRRPEEFIKSIQEKKEQSVHDEKLSDRLVGLIEDKFEETKSFFEQLGLGTVTT